MHLIPLALAWTATLAWGQPAPEVYATFEAAGVRIDAAALGEVDADAVTLEYRALGDGAWTRAHPLLRVAGGRFIGSLFWLSPGRDYEVRVAGGTPTRFSTRAPAEVGGPLAATHLVGGADGGFATIGEAAAQASPGDVIRVRPGIYRETVEVVRSGEPGAPVTFVADPGAILDGADEAMAAGEAPWSSAGDGIWHTPFVGVSRYLAVDGARIYDYSTLADLQAEAGDLPGGYYVDAEQGRLYLRLADRSDPSGRPVQVAVLPGAFHLEDQHDIVIEGFEIRHYGTGQWTGYGVDIRSSDRVTVRGNHIHHLNSGVRTRKGSMEALIEDNVIEDDGAWRWPWGSVKAHTPEASGIAIGGGRGSVVRRNTITGPFNGIYVGEFVDAPDDEVATETDVYENLIRQASDDGFEPEGACINVRFWSNRLERVKNAISLAPIQVGPTWLISNEIVDYSDHALKLNNGSSGPIVAYHNVATPAPRVDAPGAQAWAPSLPFGPMLARNNIWASHRYVFEFIPERLLAPVDMDYDALWTDRDDGGPILKWLGVRYGTLAEFTEATGLEASGLFAPPGDASLVAAGQVLAGINDGLGRPDGVPPDIGLLDRSAAPGSEGESETPADEGGAEAAAGVEADGDLGEGPSEGPREAPPGPGVAESGRAAGGCGCRVAAADPGFLPLRR